MRHSATKALLERQRRAHRRQRLVHLRPRLAGSVLRHAACSSSAARASTAITLLRKLVDIQYQRNDFDFHRGTFRVRGDVVEIFPAYEESRALRIEFFGDEVEAIAEIDPLRGKMLRRLDKIAIYPASHYVTDARPAWSRPSTASAPSCSERLAALRAENKLLEAQRLEQRTMYDLEMLRRDGLLPRHRELLAPPHRPRAGRAAADADQLLPRRLPAVHRREPRHRAADRRHVPRRPLAQGDAGRVRLPPAVGARQPAAQLRGVRGAGRTRSSTSRPRRATTSASRPAAWSSSSSSARPA